MTGNHNTKWTFDEIKDTIKILKDNEVYRISDCLKFGKDHKVIKKLICDSTYKNTLLYEFHTTKNPNFYNIMCNKKNNPEYELFDDNTLVVHIRAGDDFKRLGLGNRRNFQFYSREINNSNVEKIVIVTALHYGTSRQEKSLYNSNRFNYTLKNHDDNINIIHKFIHTLNKPVEIVSNNDIDKDFLLLVFCKNLLTNRSSGGFSKVIRKYNDIYTKSK